MKQLIFTITVLITTSLSAVENPNVASPVGSPTAVPSAGRSSLTRTPSPVAFDSNDIVTGNVGGMAHFRGIVPYSSNYYSDSNAYSPVDDFLRRTSDPVGGSRVPGQFQSYYNPRRTVNSAIRADGSGLFSPIITSQGQSDPYIPQMLPQLKNTPYGRQRPLSMSANELEKIIAKQMDVRREMDRQPLQQSSDKVPDGRVKESLFFQEYLKPQDIEPSKDIPEQKDNESTINEQPELNSTELPEQKPAKEATQRRRDALANSNTEESPEIALSETDKSQAALLLSRYETFENLAAARVTEYLAAGESLLKEGKFYKAADMFALATLWDADDARPFAGQAFSLFAAGEYMSSAFYLSQAILRNPAVASQPVDLAKLIGDRDVFENRLIEMSTWQQRSGSGELAFMMAFVMHQDGKTDKASEAIRMAVEKMPDDKAVAALYAVILPDEQKP